MSIDKNKIALETALEQERELKDELSFLQAYIKRLKSKIGDTLKHKEESQNVISDTKGSVTNENISIPEGYDNKLSIVKKFILLLKHHNRFLHFREVAEMMIEIDPTLGDSKKLAAKISAATTKLKGKHIVKYQVDKDNRKTYWGIPDWKNEDGEIKEGHEFKEGFGGRGGSTESLFDF